ncbi:MAG: 2-succinyl-5-enolpyruvyl-6-hydroxy-3-cyclohexene-1-carboxylic-acid synthase [Cyclobacteriaceae bacterium]|nr:2-succinyl-5-enolpyruvyl-6-hydroxy-3-cyclohexene-1-carboxylic-acid synthase [Cyclobacteriaceae bacterium]
MSIPAINRVASICRQKGLDQVVLCPGSRCAPLTLAFAREPGVTVRTFSDERSAGFIALGMARQLGRPVVLVCTSGTAAYNFAPAIAEAYFSEVPLVVFTADRPREWIAQHDGQTIFQPRMFGAHVKASVELPQEYAHADDEWAINRIVNDAINAATEPMAGPVHINVPLREPLYPGQRPEEPATTSLPRAIEVMPSSNALSDADADVLMKRLNHFNNILIVAGQCEPDHELVRLVDNVCSSMHIPFVAEITGNFHGAAHVIRHTDVFLGAASQDLKKSLQPDLLVTLGRGLVSRHLKTFLRQFPAIEHWHIQPAGHVADTYKNLTTIVRTTPLHFFTRLAGRQEEESFERQKQRNYFNLWEIEERRTRADIEDYFAAGGHGELELVERVLRGLPQGCNLHLANSLSVRYANFAGLPPDRADVNVFANRGTSGIDGCTSTAVGHALCGTEMNVLITGDVAFFYDRNAFWHNYNVPNLRVVLLNNHGGAIFTVVDGAGDLPETEEPFVTRQPLTSRNLCEEFASPSLPPAHKRKITNALKDFFDSEGGTRIMEIETSATVAREALNRFRQHAKRRYEK